MIILIINKVFLFKKESFYNISKNTINKLKTFLKKKKKIFIIYKKKNHKYNTLISFFTPFIIKKKINVVKIRS
ncbi:hypothetical protein ACT2CI_00510 [Candidatus Vidania fulgoroideorum]